MSVSLKRGIAIVFAANVINMLFSVISNFILPKYLSIESYGYYKIYMLYIGYLGFVHLGFVDGIYLRYGGKEVSTINSSRLLKESVTLRNSQLLLTAIVLIGAVCMRNPIAVLLAFACVPVNMIAFYKSLFQATGRFKDYGLVLSLLPMLIFVCNVVLLFCIKTDNYLFYISIVLFANLFLYLYLEWNSHLLLGKNKFFTFDWEVFRENVQTGFTLMTGNFASLLITSIDRWFIQLWMSISAFSFYSFAVSVENLFNVCVSAVTTTLYNHLCREKENAKIVKLKSTCVVIGIYLIAVAFPVKWIIGYWLQKYSAATDSLFILICAHMFYFVVKAIYVNLYKARGLQKHYSYQMIFVLSVATLSGIIAYWGISKSIESFAWSSLFTAIIWFSICYKEFKAIRGNWHEILLMSICAVVYLYMGLCVENAVWGCVCYLLIATICVIMFDRESLLRLIGICMKPVFK